MDGFIYIMSNESFGDLIKIGSSKSDPRSFRAMELSSSSGVPTPFKVEYYAFVENYKIVEKKIHSLLKYDRKNPKREFFNIDIQKAITIIQENSKIKYEENLNKKIKQKIEFEKVRQAEIQKNAQIKQQEIEFENRRQAIRIRNENFRKNIEKDKIERERLRVEKIKKEQLQLKKMRTEWINHKFENQPNIKLYKSEIILLEKKLYKLDPTLYVRECLNKFNFYDYLAFFIILVIWLLLLFLVMSYIYELFFVQNFYSWHDWDDIGITLGLFLIFLLFSTFYISIRDAFPKMVYKKNIKIEEKIEKLKLLIRNDKQEFFDNQKSKNNL